MEKKTTEKVVYSVNGIETTEWKVATTATNNLAKEVSRTFENETRSISFFCNWLHDCKTDSAKYFKSNVLGLAETATKEEVFHAFKNAYPFVNESKQLVKKQTFCKGVQTIKVVTLFDTATLSTILLAWLRNKKQEVLPEFFKTEKSKIVAISKEVAEEEKKNQETAKEEKKNKEEEKTNKSARQLAELAELAELFKTAKKLADFESIKTKYLEIL